MQRRWNSSSPTVRISSISSTSGSRFTAIENPRRTYIPLEYRRTGMSMNSPMPLKSTMRSYASRISRRESPMIAPFR